MADLAETETYEAGIYQLEITDPVIGGPDGIDNLQAKQLANRTNWLKAKIDSLLGLSVIHTATLKATPSDADEFGFLSSSAAWSLVKMTGTNLKAWLKTYFDTVYKPIGALLFSDMPSGSVIQVANYTTGTVATGTGVIPSDNTIPQTTEGTQFMSLGFTPLFSTSKLKITVKFNVAISASNAYIAALFRDETADAVASTKVNVGANNVVNPNEIVAYINANAASLSTFYVRIGAVTAATTTFNGESAGQLLGGSFDSSITIEEIKA